MCLGTCVHTWRWIEAQRSTSHVSLNLSSPYYFFFWDRLSPWERTDWFSYISWPASHRDSSVPASQLWDHRCAQLCLDAGDLSSGLHTWRGHDSRKVIMRGNKEIFLKISGGRRERGMKFRWHEKAKWRANMCVCDPQEGSREDREGQWGEGLKKNEG